MNPTPRRNDHDPIRESILTNPEIWSTIEAMIAEGSFDHAWIPRANALGWSAPLTEREMRKLAAQEA